MPSNKNLCWSNYLQVHMANATDLQNGQNTPDYSVKILVFLHEDHPNAYTQV